MLLYEFSYHFRRRLEIFLLMAITAFVTFSSHFLVSIHKILIKHFEFVSNLFPSRWFSHWIQIEVPGWRIHQVQRSSDWQRFCIFLGVIIIIISTRCSSTSDLLLNRFNCSFDDRFIHWPPLFSFHPVDSETRVDKKFNSTTLRHHQQWPFWRVIRD